MASENLSFSAKLCVHAYLQAFIAANKSQGTPSNLPISLSYEKITLQKAIDHIPFN